jgi:hypothetical protein
MGGAAAAPAQDAEGVRLVDDQEGLVRAGRLVEFLEWCQVACYREDGVGDDQGSGFFAAGECLADGGGVAMGGDCHAGTGQAAGVDEGGVV